MNPEHVSSTTVALDNLSLHAPGADPEISNYLLVIGEIANKHLEDNREAFAKAYSNLMLFGTSEWPT